MTAGAVSGWARGVGPEPQGGAARIDDLGPTHRGVRGVSDEDAPRDRPARVPSRDPLACAGSHAIIGQLKRAWEYR